MTEKQITNSRNIPVAPPYFDKALRYEVPETAALLRQSVSLTWRDIKTGKLLVIREGGRTFVPGSEIVRRSTLPELAA
jgi:hypothetical protein